MTIAEMFGQSGILALLGMGLVFSFLIILIMFVSLIAKIIKALGLDTVTDTATPAGASTGAGGAGRKAGITAAISAAVKQFRNKNGVQ